MPKEGLALRLIIGTYRKRDHIEDCLRSVDEHLRGVTDLVFVDDSGDQDHRHWLAQHGTVQPVGEHQAGYNKAMKTVCHVADGQEGMFLEEDFTFIEEVHLEQMSEMLYHRPYLAQVTLLRQAWFPVEIVHGGLIEALRAKGYEFQDACGLIEQTATFSCNPAVWRGPVFASGWPDGKWSEEIKRDNLLAEGYRFAWVPGVKVHHSGERQGFDY